MDSRQHKYSFHSIFIAICMAVALLMPGFSIAQRATPQTRITAQIDNSRRSTIVGSRSPLAIAANDIGAVDPNMQLQGITLVFSPTAAQKTALDALAAAQLNPSSPQYHRWLKPEQFAAQFGMADTDIATVSSWLERQGFAVGSVSRSRNRLTFSGSAGQVAAAFGAPLHNYKIKGDTETNFAPSADFTIPVAVGSVVQSIGNLSTFRPHSNVVFPKPRLLQPQYTAGGYQLAYLVPPDVATIYNVNPVYRTGYDGTGQTIAVVGQSEVLPQDLANFQTALGVPVRPQSLNLIPGTGASVIRVMDDVESDLDLEYSSAMAPGAIVSLYYVGNLGGYSAWDGIVYVVDNDLAGIISVSYGACEPDMGSLAGLSYLDLTFEQAAVQGQTVVVAAADYGSTSCASDGGDSRAVQHVPAVDFPASSPWVVGMGGTQFPIADLGKPVNTTYWSTSFNGDVLSSALSYIPEEVWNEYGFLGGGGGTSIYEPQPIWQAGVPGISATGFRLVPDISLNSAVEQPGYLICSSDYVIFWLNTDNCADGFHNIDGQGYETIGGTSVAAPIFAGLVAVLNQAKGYTAGQGLINPTLYSLASDGPTYATAFHDITVGNNACTALIVCLVGPQNTDYVAGVGYDEASGLGSIDFAALLAAWPQNSNSPNIATTTTLSVSSNSMQYGSPLTLTATVSSGTGAVSFFDNGVLLGPATLNSGVATLHPTFNPWVTSLQLGANSITAAYDGNTGFDPSTSEVTTVNVAVAPTTTTFATSSTTPAFGSSVTFTVTTTANNGSPMLGQGFVRYWNNGQLIGGSLVGDPPYGATSFTVSTLPAGANSITVSFDGDANYSGSTSTATVVNVAPAPTTTNLVASTASSVFGSPVTLTAGVSASGVTVTSGTVAFFSGGVSIGTGTVGNDGIATITLLSLSVGDDSITASYVGTSSFAASASTALVVAVAPSPTITTLSSSTLATTFGKTVTLTATVLAGGSPASSGMVRFLNGASVLGAVTVSSGVATFYAWTLPVGADSVTASYVGTTNFVASASSAVVVNISPVPTTTTMSSSTTTPSFGSSVTLTATVNAGGSLVTSGVVTFLNGGSAIGTGTVNSGGMATISLSTLPTGSDAITATFGGTSNFAASASSAITVTVSADITTTTLSASTISPSFGSNVTLTATVSVNGVPATSGVVAFLSNGLSVGTGAVNSSGVATVSLSTLPTGSDSITATFGGTTNLATSASNAVTVTVSPDTTTTSLSLSSTSLSFGSNVTLTATVSVNGVPATSGIVAFLSNGLPVGTGTVNGSGVATVSLSTLPTGSDSITATFGGTSNFAASASGAVTVTVSPDTTITSLSSSSTGLSYGSNVTLTATVSVSGSPATSGVVTFVNNGSSVATGPVDSNGRAIANLPSLSVGANSITASYGGASNLAPSASTAVIVTVVPDPTTTTLSPSSTNSTYGSSLSFTAMVAVGESPAASGVVTLLSGALPVATGSVNSSGVATINWASLPVGTASMTARYGGTSNLASSVSNTVLVTVDPVATTTVLRSSSPDLTYGSSVTLTATVSSSNNPVTSGTVSFLNNGLPIGAATINNGLAAISLTSLPIGSNSITVSFTGTLNFAASTSSAVVVTVSLDPTTTTLSASSINPAFGSSVTLTAAVANGSIAATNGTVTFLDGGSTIGTGLIINGVATLNLTTLPIGANSITASFAGTSTLSPSTSAAVLVSVSLDATTTTLSTSSASPAFGSSVTFTATVANGSPASSGVVTFLNGGSTIGTGTIINGVATLNLTTLPVGANSITASFGGTSTLSPSISSAVAVSVSLDATTTTLSTSSASPAFGSSVTFTATVADGASPASSGVVTFLNGGSAVGTGTVINGVATLNLTTLPTGANQVSANFGGTSSLAASASNTVLVTVTLAEVNTVTTLISSSTTPAPGDSVLFTATVTSNGTPVASGTVNFFNGGTSIGTGTVINGTATLNLATLSIGANSISASFGGMSNFAASASNAIVVTVTVPVADTPPAVTVPAPPPTTPGGVVTSTASFSAGASYSGTMMLTCKLTGPPAGAQSVPTCSMNPSTLTLAAKGAGTAVLSVQTRAASTTSQARTSGLNLWGLGAEGSALAGLFMFCVPSRRRRLLSTLALGIVFATVGFTGCGGGSVTTAPTPTVTPATTAGTYAFTITGTDALNPGITASTVVSVTVQ